MFSTKQRKKLTVQPHNLLSTLKTEIGWEQIMSLTQGYLSRHAISKMESLAMYYRFLLDKFLWRLSSAAMCLKNSFFRWLILDNLDVRRNQVLFMGYFSFQRSNFHFFWWSSLLQYSLKHKGDWFPFFCCDKTLWQKCISEKETFTLAYGSKCIRVLHGRNAWKEAIGTTSGTGNWEITSLSQKENRRRELEVTWSF